MFFELKYSKIFFNDFDWFSSICQYYDVENLFCEFYEVHFGRNGPWTNLELVLLCAQKENEMNIFAI